MKLIGVTSRESKRATQCAGSNVGVLFVSFQLQQFGGNQEWICNKPGKKCMEKHIMAHHPDMITKCPCLGLSG